MNEFSTSGQLRIAVIGVGGIGSTFTFHLARHGGHEVTVVARPGSARLGQLLADNGIISTKHEHVAVGISDTLDEDQPYDLAIVTLLAHQVDAVLPALQRSAAKNILFMFNNFEPERRRNAIGKERSAFGMPFVQASFDTAGRLKVLVGAAGQKTKLSDQRWVDLFSQAGLLAVLETHMLLWLRCHAPLCVAFESISIAGIRRGAGASWKEALVVARAVQGDKGTRIPTLSIWKGVAGQKPGRCDCRDALVTLAHSFLPRLLATGANECRALLDTIASAAYRCDKQIAVTKILAMKPS